jgi:protein-tyrosine phosphatase
MIPLIDMHCHLLAGLDDGPSTQEEALEMCRLAYAEGTRMAAATAHQNEDYPEVTPPRIRSAWERLVQQLRDAGIPRSNRLGPRAGFSAWPTSVVIC